MIAIIGILASVVLASLNSARAKGRDACRLSDMDSLQKALALYESDNQAYPISTSTTTLDGTDSVSTALTGAGTISSIPQDPTSPTNVYTYSSDANGSTYLLSFCLETNPNPRFAQGCGNTIKP